MAPASGAGRQPALFRSAGSNFDRGGLAVKKASAVQPVKEKRHFVRYLPLYLMMVPGIVYIIINNYIPMTGIVVAFKQYNTRLGLYNSPNI